MPLPSNEILSPREILSRLIAFPTVSRDSNLALVDWVEGYLSGFGIRCHRVPSPCGRKASLYAQAGPDVPGGVVLSGHTDVVPVDGQAWDTDPWTLVERDGRLHGRGTCDMKGFDALAIAALPLALAAGVKRPLQLALSHDEELGCIGAPPMIADMAARLPRAGAVIVGEPSMMKPVSGHKGSAGIATHVQGFEVHSSLLPTGVSAIMEGAKLITWAARQNEANMAKTPGEVAAMFHPPFTTLHVGMISGGTAHNITARDCRFTVDIRCVPGERLEDWVTAYRSHASEVEAGMKAIHTDAAITLDQVFTVPALRPEPDGAAETLVRRLTGDNGVHVVSYGTEAGQFQEAGFSTIVCGPGDIAQAHQPNEFVTAAQFDAGWAFMQRLVGELAA